MQDENLTVTTEKETDDLLGNPTALDHVITLGTKSLAETTMTRRSFLGWAAKVVLALAGATLVEVLPIDREVLEAEATAGNCNAWYMCGIYASNVCKCSSGSNTCPGDTHPGSGSGNYWAGCCFDGTSNKRVLYYDCCDGHPPSSCSTPGCQCYRGGGSGVWCGGLNQLCCTIWAISGSC